MSKKKPPYKLVLIHEDLISPLYHYLINMENNCVNQWQKYNTQTDVASRLLAKQYSDRLYYLRKLLDNLYTIQLENI